MRIFKLLFAVIFWLIYNQKCLAFDINPIYSVEQEQILNTPLKNPYFLVADQLKYLNPKDFITSGFDSLSQNISLSSIIIDANPNPFNHFNNYYGKNNTDDNADLENIKGYNYALLGSFKLAILHYEKSLTLFYKIERNEDDYYFIYENLAQLYISQNDFEQSKKYNQLLIEYARQEGNNQLLIDCLIFKANLLLGNGEIKQAENMILKNVLLINNGLNGKKKEQACYLQLGKIYLQAKRYTEAKWFFIQSLTLSNQLNINAQKVESLLLLAKAKNAIKDFSLALADLKIVEKLIQNGFSIYETDYKLQLEETYFYLHRPIKTR